MTLQFCDTCDVCGQELTEYVGFGIKAGEGGWYCKRCESGEELCIEFDSDNVTPVDPFFIDPGMDLSLLELHCKSVSTSSHGLKVRKVMYFDGYMLYVVIKVGSRFKGRHVSFSVTDVECSYNGLGGETKITLESTF